MTEHPLILVIEDETSLTTLLRYNLEGHGFLVAAVENGADAMGAIAEARPDLVLLDWMLPGLSGIEICRKIRRDPESNDLPVILLTARGEESDRVRGLDFGADDYVVKPFGVSELIARIGAVLRRVQPASHASSLGVGDITMDLASHRVMRNGRQVHLGPTEYRLLRHFMEHPGRVLSRDHLLEAVWGRAVHIERRHRGRACPTLAPDAERRRRGRHHPNRSLDRLRPRRLRGAGRLRYSGAGASAPGSGNGVASAKRSSTLPTMHETLLS